MSSSDSATFWLIGVPNAASSGSTRSNKNTDKDLVEEAKLTRRQLDMSINKYAKLSDFPIPKLKVGTLDSLMQLSDDLVKIDQQMEAAVLKIARNYTDLKTNDKLLVDEKSPHFYVEGFKWNAAKYPPDSTLQQLVEKIHSELLSMDEDLKKRFSKFAEVQQTLTAIERKETGSLVVRPLGKLINEADIIEREYITSVIVVVPVQREQEFIDTYEILEDLMAEIQRKREEEQKARDDARAVHDKQSRPAKEAAKEKSKTTQSALSATSGFDEDEHSQPADGSHAESHDGAKKAETKQEAVVEKKLPCKTVVPRSHKKLYADSEFALYRVMVLRKGKDAFARHCQEKRYTVRTFLHDAKQIEHEEEKKNDLINEKNKLMGELIQYCRTYYSELFVGWMHLKAIRTFVESVLRYGIPVNFQALVLQPVKGYRPKLRKVLQDIYGKLSGSEFAESDGADVGADASGVSEFYPYVYLPINIEEATLEY